MQETLAVTKQAPASPHGKQLRLPCLDGGGVRGLSSLLILQKIMEMIEPDDPPKPCDYFDMIGGTSTGGLIAIMLGRLQMSVQECIDEYIVLFSSIFTKKKHRVGWNAKIQGRFDHEALEDGIKRVVKQRLGDENALFKDTSHKDGCKTFVCATSAATSEIVIISSYYSDRRVNDLRNTARIWEVGRATSAAMSFFDPIKIKGSVFLDGGTGANNPVKFMWAEARDMFAEDPGWKLEDNILCLVSIGTGQPLLQRFGDSVLGTDILDALVKITTNTESIANEFHQSHASLFEQGLAYRFNVEQGLENVALEDAGSVEPIEEATRRYISIEKSNSSLRRCVAKLRFRENLENIALELSREYSARCSQWSPLEDSDIDLCFIPYTSAYVKWISEGDILGYVKPPTSVKTRMECSASIGPKVIAYSLDKIADMHPRMDARQPMILYHDCESHANGASVLGSWCLQLLSASISYEVRLAMWKSLFENVTIRLFQGSDSLLDSIRSRLTFEELQRILLSAIPHVNGPLVVGLENLSLHIGTRNPTRPFLISVLMICVELKADTFVIVSDGASVDRPPSMKNSEVNIVQLMWNTEWKVSGGSQRNQTVSDRAALTKYTQTFLDGYEEIEFSELSFDEDNVNARTGLELAVDHLKVTFGQLKAVSKICNRWAFRCHGNRSLQEKVRRATGLYYAEYRAMDDARTGFYGIVVLVLDQLRTGKLQGRRNH